MTAPDPKGTLFVVGTPLGNLQDITLRAIEVLKRVALVACEDTRRTATLLRAHEVSTPTTSYFEHNERWKGERILDALRPAVHAKGTDYTAATVPEAAAALRLGILTVITGDPKAHASREIVARIRSSAGETTSS